MPPFVGREKMFKQHADNYQYYGDKAGRNRQLEEIKEQQIGLLDETFGHAWYPQTRVPRPYRLLRAQFNDSICVYNLLEVLLASQKGIYIRPEYLDGILSRMAPQYYWPVSIIGRMMAGLKAVCITEYFEVPDTDLPFAKGRDSRGKYYVIDPKGGNEGFLWLLRCRNIMARKVDDMMARQSVGDFATDAVGFTQPQVLYGEWFENTRIRDEAAYVAQQEPGLPWRARVSREPSDDPFAS